MHGVTCEAQVCLVPLHHTNLLHGSCQLTELDLGDLPSQGPDTIPPAFRRQFIRRF